MGLVALEVLEMIAQSFWRVGPEVVGAGRVLAIKSSTIWNGVG